MRSLSYTDSSYESFASFIPFYTEVVQCMRQYRNSWPLWNEVGDVRNRSGPVYCWETCQPYAPISLNRLTVKCSFEAWPTDYKHHFTAIVSSPHFYLMDGLSVSVSVIAGLSFYQVSYYWIWCNYVDEKPYWFKKHFHSFVTSGWVIWTGRLNWV